MAYINERVSEADIGKYGLRELCRRHGCLDLNLQWTVDRQRGSFLLVTGRNPQDPSMREMVFHWGGGSDVEQLQVDTQLTEDRRYLMRWRRLAAPVAAATPEAARQQQDYLAALKEALTAFRIRGLDSPDSVTYVADFDF